MLLLANWSILPLFDQFMTFRRSVYKCLMDVGGSKFGDTDPPRTGCRGASRGRDGVGQTSLGDRKPIGYVNGVRCVHLP